MNKEGSPEERRPEDKGWLIARRYADEKAALRAWRLVRRVMLSEDIDMSVLRFFLDGQSHLALLGEGHISKELSARVNEVIVPISAPAQLPTEVVEALRSRRREFRQTGLPYMQRRNQA